MRSLSIRPLRSDDLDRIFSPASRQLAEEWLLRQAGSEMCVAVAEVDGDPVGRANLDFVQRAAAGVAFLWAAHVDAAHQSRGIGTALISHLEALASERGFSRIQLAVGKENPRAFRLYERLGYEVCGEEVDRWSYLDGDRVVEVAEDCWTMEKHLASPPP